MSSTWLGREFMLSVLLLLFFFFFFFQAEDGIRDLYVTGVQTCSSDLPALWNIHTGKRVEVGATAVARAKKPGDGPGPATAVNASGVVVAGGLVYRDGRQVTLEAPGGETAKAAAVADTDLIVGRSVDDDGETTGPKVWRC